jgi:uncharacterized protein YfcZ (UPF0381/DUF406 family)
MSTITFDTLDATRKLRDAGFNEKQAETVVRVLSDAQSNLANKLGSVPDCLQLDIPFTFRQEAICFKMIFLKNG